MRERMMTGLLLLSILDAMGWTTMREQQIPKGFGGIEGRVVDLEGRSISGARVYAFPVGRPASRQPTTYTDDKGHFYLIPVAVGENMVHAAKEDEGYFDTFFAFFSVDPRANPNVMVYDQRITNGIVVQLGQKGARLVGEVLDARTSQPIPDATLHLAREDGPKNFLDTVLERGTGKFRILVPPIGFRLKVSAPGYKDWYYGKDGSKERAEVIRLTPNATKELLIPLQRIP